MSPWCRPWIVFQPLLAKWRDSRRLEIRQRRGDGMLMVGSIPTPAAVEWASMDLRTLRYHPPPPAVVSMSRLQLDLLITRQRRGHGAAPREVLIRVSTAGNPG